MEPFRTQDTVSVSGREFRILRLLGKGKGGYSYLAADKAARVVLKQIHHEPCDYYRFGNKLEAELRDYNTLRALGLPMPRLLLFDAAAERIVKEYIDGPTVCELVQSGALPEACLTQMRQMCTLLYPAGLNIDYYPTNFVLQNGILYYIDYECNAYSDKWNFENWGIRYWSKTSEFLKDFPCCLSQ